MQRARGRREFRLLRGTDDSSVWLELRGVKHEAGDVSKDLSRNSLRAARVFTQLLKTLNCIRDFKWGSYVIRFKM